MPFPPDFLWGSATSAHQVEGNNTSSDWWAWEQEGRVPFKSGLACDHFNRYDEDFDLARDFGQNAHRFSIEWARIEPQEGCFSDEAIRHYTQVIASLRRRGLEPFVTLHHFTNPKWFQERGGWVHRRAPFFFKRYAAQMAQSFKGQVRFWITINEPLVYVYQSYLARIWPADQVGIRAALSALFHFEEAHRAAFDLLHQVQMKGGGGESVQVGVAQAIRLSSPCKESWLPDRAASYLRDYAFNTLFLDRLTRRRALDFIGINYYTRDFVHWGGKGLLSLFGEVCPNAHAHTRTPRSALGWEVYPEGLYKTLLRLKKYHLPLYVTENGFATDDDAEREEFIKDHLTSVRRALEAGTPVKGYFYWSLLDNFEWAEGTRPRFGLVEVDFQSLRRAARPSARRLREIILTEIG
ncbi:MAG: glycoside hydrolase family 1 protein [Candidatus Omnitrophica bacterium]|nr:glycoside hydrolase family 1 protein [Candidatus Omnitrophota bacterium]